MPDYILLGTTKRLWFSKPVRNKIMEYFWTTVFNSGEFVFWKGIESEVRRLASKYYKNKIFDIGFTSKASYDRSGNKGN